MTKSKKRPGGGPEPHSAQRQRASAGGPPSRHVHRKSGGGGGMLFAVVPAILVVVLGVAGIWYASGDRGKGNATASTAANETAALLTDVTWPTYVSRGPSSVKEAYQFAVARPDVLKYMPCYCGCGGHNGHRNNGECFIQSINQGGATIAFDQHGST